MNPYYLDIGAQSHIQLQFEKDSQIELADFFLVQNFVNTLYVCLYLNLVGGWMACMSTVAMNNLWMVQYSDRVHMYILPWISG